MSGLRVVEVTSLAEAAQARAEDVAAGQRSREPNCGNQWSAEVW
jgi:hypothetical protein